MKRVFLTFVMAVLLATSLTACTTRPTNGDTTGDAAARNRTRSGSVMDNDGHYYANDRGRVYDNGTHNSNSMGDDVRRAADDVMDGMGDAVRDMTR